MNFDTVRLGVALARQPSAAGMTVDEIARDAAAITETSARIRRALERQKKPNGEVTKVRTVAEKYGARVVEQMDVEGCVIGLRFVNAMGPRGLYFVT